jgi:hypothetical protein
MRKRNITSKNRLKTTSKKIKNGRQVSKQKIKTTSKKNGNLKKKWQPQKKTEAFLLAYNQSTKINLIGCDTIVKSPSYI